MDKNNKKEALRAILSGKKINEANQVPIFLEYDTIPGTGIYFDKKGNRLTELEMMQQVETAKKRTSIVWHEITQYDN